MINKTLKYCCIVVTCMFFSTFGAFAQKKSINNSLTSLLQKGFQTPADSIKPFIYWYWISDNISKEGITKDLEAMAKVGSGEAFIGNIGLNDEPYGKVKVLSDEWWQLTQHAIREGKRLGVNIGIFNSPGWSQSGGPWVKPSEAMRYLVSSEVNIEGGQHITKKLIKPKDTFQDVAVVAFPAPLNDAENIADYKPKVRTIPQIKDAALLFDNDIQKTTLFPQDIQNKSITIDVEVSNPFTIRSLVLYPGETPFYANVELQAYKNGVYETVKKFIFDRSNAMLGVGPIPYGEVAIAFPEVTSDKFRLVISNIAQDLGQVGGLKEICLSSSPKLDEYSGETMPPFRSKLCHLFRVKPCKA